MSEELAERIESYLRELARFPDRRVGGPGNRAATEFFSAEAARLGLSVTRTPFGCLDWEFGPSALVLGDSRIDVHAGPYSRPCEVTAPLRTAERVEEIEEAEPTDLRGAVLLLHGEIARGQIMPKNFTFYNPEEHRRIVRALEASGAAAVIAATGRDPYMVGGQCPFPLFEDGDLAFPNSYLTEEEGAVLAAHAGERVSLTIDSRRIPAEAEQVVAVRVGCGAGRAGGRGAERVGEHGAGRVVVSAHIDSREGSPGGLDNASGVTVLLGLAELLADYAGGPDIELVPFNGEDNYAAPGEMLWLASNSAGLGDVLLAINIDDAGERGSVSHVSCCECSPEIEAAVGRVAGRFASVEEGPQWFQSDHAIFAQQGVPALAIASSTTESFMAERAHTERDTPDFADPALLAEIARFVRAVIAEVAGE